MLGFSPLSQVPISTLPTASLDVSFAGTTTIIFGQTGDLHASSVPAGTTTITFGQTGALKAGAILAGSTTITFGQSGALLSAAALTGSTPVLFGQTGALLSQSAFAGSSAITFSQTGDIKAAGAFAGSTPITFGQTGDFVAGTSGANFAGSTSIFFSQSGALLSNALFAGQTTVIFGASGDFVAGTSGVTTAKGDDADPRNKRPVPFIRPKVERDLDDVLEIVNEATDTRRTSENRKTIKAALAKLQEVSPPPNYAAPIAAIGKALKNVSRGTAKHQGMQAAVARVAADLEAVIMAMETERKAVQARRYREQRDLEAIAWLLS